VLVGLDFNITKNVDWSLAVWKEIEVTGTIFSGREFCEAHEVDAFDLALDLIARDPGGYSGLVSHLFPIEQYHKSVCMYVYEKEAECHKGRLGFQARRTCDSSANNKVSTNI